MQKLGTGIRKFLVFIVAQFIQLNLIPGYYKKKMYEEKTIIVLSFPPIRLSPCSNDSHDLGVGVIAGAVGGRGDDRTVGCSELHHLTL